MAANLHLITYKEKAKMKNQAEFFCVARYKFTLQIWWRVNQLFYITSEVILNRTIRRCLVYHSDIEFEQNL